MRILILLIASSGLAQQQSPNIQEITRLDGTPCQGTDYWVGGTPGLTYCLPAPPSIESRVERLEKAVEKLTTAQPSAYLPTSHVTVWDAAARKARILTLAEANDMLVALANAINEASAQRAAEGGNEQEREKVKK